MKILAYTSPARGHLFPTVPILLESQRRGHTIALRTLAAEVPRMRELGFAAEAISPEIEGIVHDDHLAKSSLGAITRAIRVGARRAVLEVPELEQVIRAESPDVLLIDTNTWGAAAVAEAWGGPWAILQHFPSPMASKEAPPFGPGFRRASGPLGRLRDRVLRPLISAAFERALLPPTNEVRRGVGLRPVRNAAELFTRAPLVLYFTSTAFEYRRSDWPRSFCFIGPVMWEPPSEAPAWLDTITRPIVLVTTSTEFQDDASIVQASLTGLAEEDVFVLATMPAGVRPFPLPSNARVEQFVAHSHVLPRAEVVVTHGGMGATQKALAAGVPVVVVPFGRDQLEVGRRAEATGAGEFLPRRKLSPENLRAAVQRARTRTPAAAAFAATMRREGGASLAVDRIERLVLGDARP